MISCFKAPSSLCRLIKNYNFNMLLFRCVPTSNFLQARAGEAPYHSRSNTPRLAVYTLNFHRHVNILSPTMPHFGGV